MDSEKVIKAWEIFRDSNPYQICDGKEFRAIKEPEYCMGQMIEDTIVLLKEQERNEGNCEEWMSDCFEPWDVLWKAPDGTFKGRCDNCGFVHIFIEGHVKQYKYCPQCGEQKQDL